MYTSLLNIDYCNDLSIFANIISVNLSLMCINRLFAYCKGGTFNIHIWAWFSYFICQEGEIKFYLKFGKELISFLCCANVREFMKILTIYTLNSHLLTFKAHNHKMYVFCRPLKYLKPHRQTVSTEIRQLLEEQSDLGSQCLPLCLCFKNRHFQIQLFCWRFKD